MLKCMRLVERIRDKIRRQCNTLCVTIFISKIMNLIRLETVTLFAVLSIKICTATHDCCKTVLKTVAAHLPVQDGGTGFICILMIMICFASFPTPLLKKLPDLGNRLSLHFSAVSNCKIPFEKTCVRSKRSDITQIVLVLKESEE